MPPIGIVSNFGGASVTAMRRNRDDGNGTGTARTNDDDDDDDAADDEDVVTAERRPVAGANALPRSTAPNAKHAATTDA